MPGFLVQVRRNFAERGVFLRQRFWRRRIHRQFREAEMRKWFKNADSDDITMLVSGAVAVLAFCTFVMVWFIEAPGSECGRNCSTDFSSVNRR
jgi:hypothetical protein